MNTDFLGLMCQSIPNLTIPPGIFLKERINHSPGKKKVRKLDPWGRKIVLKPHPRGNYFKKFSKKTKHGTEIMKNSTEMLICSEILKQWNIKKPKAFWWVTFMDIQSISNHSPFVCKPTQEIHEKQAPNYDFDK